MTKARLISRLCLAFLIVLLLLHFGAKAAWAHEASPVIVALIDTGVDVQHQALQGHTWQNPGEIGTDRYGQDKSHNGLDDDGNGWVDDVSGYNFAQGNAQIGDSWGHGTHIAGIIAQSSTAKIMVLKALIPNQRGDSALRASVQSIRYAIQMGAQIINYSAGGNLPAPEEKAALQEAERKHILVVAAAGNDREDNDLHGFYPAAYALPNILSVAAVDLVGNLLPSSNFGMRSVRIAAPGLNILSSLPGGSYGAMTGTSQATALVTQAAATYCSHQRRCPAEATIAKLIGTGDHSRQLDGKLEHPIVLNALRVSQQN